MSNDLNRAALPIVSTAGTNLELTVGAAVVDQSMAAFGGKIVNIRNDGSQTLYLSAGFGSAATAVQAPAASGANKGRLIPAGEERDFYIPESVGPTRVFWLRLLASGASATVTICRSSR
jgi:starvation-inducible outer membrane lipoprotein